MNVEWPVEKRARVHASLGDPARLAIVDMLTVTDVSPGEIARELGLPTNLLAHHLNVLTDAAVVLRIRSEGDRRRTYLRLRPDALAALTLPTSPRSPRLPQSSRVVFVCTHNSARSQLAAALWAHRTHRPTASAGTSPAPRVHPRAVKVANRHGLKLDHARTEHVDQVVTDDDLVIAVCDNAFEDLTGSSNRSNRSSGSGRVWPRMHWSVPDPARVNTDAAFEAAYADLAGRIDRLAPTITHAGTGTQALEVSS